MAGYGTDGGFTSWLAENGYVLPPNAPAPAILRQRGSDYVDATYEPKLACSVRAAGWEQERAFPRNGHFIQCVEVIGIPVSWINASYRAAWLEAITPGWASGSVDPNRRTKREKADVLEREFFAPGDTGVSGVLGNVDAAINGMVTPLFCRSVGFGIAVV